MNHCKPTGGQFSFQSAGHMSIHIECPVPGDATTEQRHPEPAGSLIEAFEALALSKSCLDEPGWRTPSTESSGAAQTVTSRDLAA